MELTHRQRRRRAHAILKNSVWDPITGCILWTGSIGNHGYGQYRTKDDNLLAHRMIYEMLIGKIPDGYHVHHECGKRYCVNPFHLSLLSASDHWRIGNSASAVRARKTHCQHGHPFSPDNTYVNKRGHRRCRICHNNSEKDRRQRKNGPFI